MKKYKELSIWFRFSNAILCIVSNRFSQKRAFAKMYEDEAKAMVDRYAQMNFESKEQNEERKRLAPSAKDILNGC
jgi:hypothetical protein